MKVLAAAAILCVATSITSCDLKPLGDKPLVASQTVDETRINTSLGAVGRIQTGMTESDLDRLGYPSKRSEVTLEGDTYTSIRLEIGEGKHVDCLFASGLVDSISISSSGIVDESDIGVGSTLGRLREANPEGKLLIGDADGRFANFVNGTKVVFQMDQRSLQSTCFEYEADSCEVGPETKVVGIVVNAGPAGW